MTELKGKVRLHGVDKAIQQAESLANRFKYIGKAASQATQQISIMQRAKLAGVKVPLDTTSKEVDSLKEAGRAISIKEAKQRQLNQTHQKTVQLMNLRATAHKLQFQTGKKMGDIDKMSARRLQQLNASTKLQMEKQMGLRDVLLKNRTAVMGIGFALMFAARIMARAFTDALRNLFSNYKDVMDETSAFHQMTNQLSGAWTFFKFTLIDALMQSSLFKYLIEGLINIINRVSEFTAKYPKLARAIVIFLAIGAVVFTLATVLGYAGMALFSFSILNKTAMAAVIPHWFSYIGVVLKTIGIFILLYTAFILLSKIWSSDMPIWEKLTWTLATAVGGVGAAWALVGKKALLAGAASLKAIIFLMFTPLGLIIAAIGIFIYGMYLLSKRVGGVGNAFKALGIFLLATFALIGDGLYALIYIPLKMIVDLINTVIRGSNRFLGTNFNEIELPKVGFMSKGVWDMRNKLLEQGKKDSSPVNPFAEDGSLKNDTYIPDGGTNLPEEILDSVNDSAEFDKLLLDVEKESLEIDKMIANYSEESLGIEYKQLDEQKKMNDAMGTMNEYLIRGGEVISSVLK